MKRNCILMLLLIFVSQASCNNLRREDTPQYLRNRNAGTTQSQSPLSAIETGGPRDVSVVSLALSGQNIFVVTKDGSIWLGAGLGQSWTSIGSPQLHPTRIAATSDYVFFVEAVDFYNDRVYKKPVSGGDWQPLSALNDHCFNLVADSTNVYALCSCKWRTHTT